MLLKREDVILPALPGKQRVLLAALLLKANGMVSLNELTEAVWGPHPPVSAQSTLRNYVKQLRKALGGGDSQLGTVPGGYQIRVAAANLDISRFEALRVSALASVSAGAWDQASAQLRAAASLWRGEPLADVPSELLASREVPRLAEMWLQTVEARIEADLQLGRHADAIADLQRLAALHPFRERLHAQLMLALYRDGQQAESLAAYQRVRETLLDELGVEPGLDLRLLQQQILTADPALTGPAVARPRSSVGSAATVARQRNGAAVPRQLPAAVPYFTGRTAELAALTSMLGDTGVTGRTMVISAVAGTAGVGKTATAVYWAHQVADRFPDGQLYVDLRGYAAGEPMPESDALAGFLRALGEPGQDIPSEADERAARYRSLLSRRKVLVVLDNAASAEQVRPLLPGDPACAVVVTSRDALTGLVARDGARRLDLDLLPLEDAVGLLRGLIGARVDADPAGAEMLAAQCCRLPLALRVAAELAIARAGASVADLVYELADQWRRLDLLDAGGDPRTAVRAVFSWSYRHLAADAARAVRLAGLHPGPDLDRYAVAALVDTALEQAGRLLDVLARANLIQSAGPGRWGMHDLLRAYALDRATAEDEEAERQLALTRLFDYYLGTAAAAMDTLFPAEADRRPRIPAPASPAPLVAEPAAARAWLDTERATLVDVAAYTAARGWPGHTTRLAATVFRYLEAGGYYPEINEIQGQACRGARDTGDPTAEARALGDLSVVDLRQGRYQQATEKLALSHFRW
jgi:DNA-binding SARP family transcriptional activator